MFLPTLVRFCAYFVWQFFSLQVLSVLFFQLLSSLLCSSSWSVDLLSGQCIKSQLTESTSQASKLQNNLFAPNRQMISTEIKGQ